MEQCLAGAVVEAVELTRMNVWIVTAMVPKIVTTAVGLERIESRYHVVVAVTVVSFASFTIPRGVNSNQL